MIASKHYAMLEHGTVYLSVPDIQANEDLIQELLYNKFTHLLVLKDVRRINFSTNLRVLIEKGIWDI